MKDELHRKTVAKTYCHFMDEGNENKKQKKRILKIFNIKNTAHV